jgi:hypothetical protein
LRSSHEIRGSTAPENPTTDAMSAPRRRSEVLVEKILPRTREKLVTLAVGAPLIDAAKLLRAGTDIVVCAIRRGSWRGSSPRRMSSTGSAFAKEPVASPLLRR